MYKKLTFRMIAKLFFDRALKNGNWQSRKGAGNRRRYQRDSKAFKKSLKFFFHSKIYSMMMKILTLFFQRKIDMLFRRRFEGRCLPKIWWFWCVSSGWRCRTVVEVTGFPFFSLITAFKTAFKVEKAEKDRLCTANPISAHTFTNLVTLYQIEH